MEIMPIGSVICIADSEFMIIGYQLVMKEKIRGYYRLVSADGGYRGKGSVGAIPIEFPYQIRRIGRKTESFERFQEGYFRYMNSGEGYRIQEVDLLLKEVLDAVWKGTESDE